jgi:DeoR/GlpR family transcriptional regulator of sugar metabolism
MRKKATKSCLLADSSKMGNTALAKTGTLSDFDVFITNQAAPAAYLAKARKMARQVIIAQ